ncbi:MAG TPA: hypothetical protein QF821_00075 [Candidatus Thalassarchaeaceae archaeon]|nr:hypothetical protein [Candidatus Thalassarchaeaceae archaeon]
MSGEILVDTETWGTRELLEVIASRFFELGNEGAYPNSWEVRGIDDQEVGQQLLQINMHLEPMGLIGSLEESNPPILTITRIPSGSSVLESYQQLLIWIVMATFMTLVGTHWVSEYGYGENSSISEVSQSFLFFTLPVMVSLGLASYCRVFVARKFRIEIGHIAPIVLPIPTWWPFGIVGVLGQRKTDLVPMPNRRALGSVEVVIPLVLFLSGSILTVAGLVMTPSSPPELSGPPTVFDTNLITRSLVESWMGDEIGIRLQWLHPIGISGVGLSIIGWGLMLPIPGLPGDRLLHAVIGPSKMRSGSTQTSIFLLVLFAMVVVFATSQWTPWIFLAFVAAWQRFNPDSLPQPIVLDENAGLEERFRSRFVVIAAIVLLVGLPGAVPSYEMEDYISGISTESWPEELHFTPGVGEQLTLPLEPGGVMPVSGWVQARIEGPDTDGWTLENSCSESAEACRFDGVTQTVIRDYAITISPPEEDFTPHILRILVEVSGFEVEHLIKLSSIDHEGIIEPFWELSGDSENPVICVDIDSREGGIITIEGSYWESLNDSNMSSGIQELCLRGHEGAIQNSDLFDEQGRVFGPGISLTIENSTIGPWTIAIHDSGPLIQVERGLWTIPSGFASVGDILFHSDFGAPFCPSSDVAAQIETGSNWSVEMENYTAIRIKGNQSGIGTIGIGKEGWLAVCHDNGTVMESFTIRESVDVYVQPAGLNRGLDVEEFTVMNRASEKMGLAVEWHGDSPQSGIWEVEIVEWLESGESGSITVNPVGLSNLERAVWVTADGSGVTVHLSARCPSEGC